MNSFDIDSLLKLSPVEFEELIKTLLTKMQFNATTPYYILPGFEKIAEEYFYANHDVAQALAITKGTFEIPSSAIKVADGLWKQKA